MPTTTIFGDPADGYNRSQDAAYAVARATGTLAFFGTILNVGQDNSGIWCQESLVGFDTSGLTGTVTAATLSLWCTSNGTLFTAEARVFDWGTVADTADWVAGDSLAGLTLVATLPQAFTVGAYNDFADVALAANINQAGFTRLLINSDRQRLGTAPTGTDESAGFTEAGAAGTTNDPSLTVTTALVPSAALSGSALASITEGDVVAGGKVLTITLTNATWIP
ncbi:MAG TPA: hypothetical protein VGR09_07205 [Gemmatimonadales bacterium]|nr:hypothetical protein [Gemmatimonadales bacterium]